VLRDAGARVVAVGRDAGRLRDLLDSLETVPTSSRRGAPASPLAAAAGSVRTEVCDLGDETAVAALAERIHATDGPVDGVLHLVGGWRGGGGLAGQTDADFRFLEGSLTALRHVSRAICAPPGPVASRWCRPRRWRVRSPAARTTPR